MKEHKTRFIKQSIIFVIVLIITVLLLNKLFYTLVIPKYSQFRVEKEFQDYIKNNSKIDYVFLGASHTQYSMNPKYIPNSFNLGFNSNTYLEIYYKLKKAIYQDKINVKYVILEMDLSTFNSYMLGHTFPLKYEVWYYSDFVPLNEISILTNKSKLVITIERFFPFIGRGKDLLVNYKKPSLIYKGWEGASQDFSKTDIVSFTTKRIYTQYNGQSKIDSTILDYFLKTLRLAKDNNISIIFIIYPVTKIYDELLSKMNITREDYYLKLFNVSESILTDYHLFNYYGMFFNHTEYFDDADHINIIGSEILSKQVYKDLQKLDKSSFH